MFRSIVYQKQATTARTAFYATIMAFHDLIFKESKKPDNYVAILSSLEDVHPVLDTATHHTTVELREKNIAKITGLIQKSFIKVDVADLGIGAALAVDFENSLRLSRFERNRYELKIGRSELALGAKPSPDFYQKIAATACGIANCGPGVDGFIYFGVADKKSGADRVQQIFNSSYVDVAGHYFVGVDYEMTDQGIDISEYIRQIIKGIGSTQLSEPLKTNLLSQITHGVYRGKTFVRMRIPSQTQLSGIGERYFIRKESETKEMSVSEALAQAKLFG